MLVMTMAVLLAAGLLMVGRIAQAGDMFTRAQAGADAAALGTLAPLRDEAVALALQGLDPSAAGYWLVGEPKAAAAKYADENGVNVDKVRLSGVAGNTAMVSVATKECQLKNKDELTEKELDDLRNKRNLCTDSSGETGIGRFATAKAVAKLIVPECRAEYPLTSPPRTPGVWGRSNSLSATASGFIPKATARRSPGCSSSAWSTRKTRSSTTGGPTAWPGAAAWSSPSAPRPGRSRRRT